MLFADDIKINGKIESGTDVERVESGERLERIYEWSTIWKLPLAPEKSVHMRLEGSECSAWYSL